MSDTFKRATSTASYVRERLPASLHYPKVAIICGSGLGGLTDSLQEESKRILPYSEIPNFADPTVPGHVGKLAFGLLGTQLVPSVCMVGRFHYYEGYGLDVVTFPIRVFKILGVEILLVTNAAGGLNDAYNVGDIVLLEDHINLPGLTGIHPLRGPNADDFGLRFIPLSDAYDLEIRQKVKKVAEQTGIGARRRIHEGTYAYVTGPTYESRAEARLLIMMGADTVGMSTVPEVIVARHCGIRVLAMSVVTNKVVLDSASIKVQSNTEYGDGAADHEEVLQVGKEAADDLQLVVSNLIDTLL